VPLGCGSAQFQRMRATLGTAKMVLFGTGVNKNGAEMNVHGGTIDEPSPPCANQHVPKTGRPKMPSAEAQQRGARLKALRERLEISQEEFVRRSGLPNRTYVSKFENGKNQASSLEAISALARGFGLTIQQMQDYIAGTFEPVLLPNVAPPVAAADSAAFLEEKRKTKETVSKRASDAISTSVGGVNGVNSVSRHAKPGTRKRRVRGASAR